MFQLVHLSILFHTRVIKICMTLHADKLLYYQEEVEHLSQPVLPIEISGDSHAKQLSKCCMCL